MPFLLLRGSHIRTHETAHAGVHFQHFHGDCAHVCTCSRTKPKTKPKEAKLFGKSAVESETPSTWVLIDGGLLAAGYLMKWRFGSWLFDEMTKRLRATPALVNDNFCLMMPLWGKNAVWHQHLRNLEQAMLPGPTEWVWASLLGRSKNNKQNAGQQRKSVSCFWNQKEWTMVCTFAIIMSHSILSKNPSPLS